MGYTDTSNFIKKETLAQMFSYEFCEISKKTFFYRTPLGDCFFFFVIFQKLMDLTLDGLPWLFL